MIKYTMVSLKCGICILLLISLIEARQTATNTPDLKPPEESPIPVDSPMLRSGPDHYDMYPFGDLTGLPIPDVAKTILIDHQAPKKYSIADDTPIDYEDSDLILDSPILDPILDSAQYEPPYDIPPFSSYVFDAGTLIKTPLIKSPLINAPLIRTPLIKLPLIKRPWLKRSVLQSIQTPLVPSPLKKKISSLREIETILKTLLPLFKNTSLPMRARLQIGRQGEEVSK